MTRTNFCPWTSTTTVIFTRRPPPGSHQPRPGRTLSVPEVLQKGLKGGAEVLHRLGGRRRTGSGKTRISKRLAADRRKRAGPSDRPQGDLLAQLQVVSDGEGDLFLEDVAAPMRGGTVVPVPGALLPVIFPTAGLLGLFLGERRLSRMPRRSAGFLRMRASTSCPSCSTSEGLSTLCRLSWEMWMRPSTPSSSSTKAPKSAKRTTFTVTLWSLPYRSATSCRGSLELLAQADALAVRIHVQHRRSSGPPSSGPPGV